mmetsp:Transcript_10558/g.42611  ORF Transcript_10558/g.42611 Transcript_10558/m.42611 type:complete len:211 (+) Transcript_10558:296-928(+)
MGGRAGPRRRRVGARPNHRRDRQARRALLPRRRARGDGRGVRPAATATGGSGGCVPRAREGGQPDPTRRCADPRRERRRRRMGSAAAGAPRDADAVAAERLRRGGGRRLRAARSPRAGRGVLGRPGRRPGRRRTAGADPLLRRAEDRRSVRVGEVRAGASGAVRVPRGRAIGGGRDAADGGVHRCASDAGRKSERVARGARGSRRGVHRG